MPTLEKTIGTPGSIAEAVRRDLVGEKLTKANATALSRYHESVVARALAAMPRRLFAELCGVDSRQLPPLLRRAGLPSVVGAMVRPSEIIAEAFERLAKHNGNGKAPRLEVAASTTTLAQAMGVTRRRVTEWHQVASWPFGDAGPYPVAAVRRWVEIQRVEAETSDKLGELEIAIKQEDLRKRRLVNADLAGRTVDREAARSKLLGLMRAWGAGLLSMCGPTARQFQARGLIDDDQISEAEAVVEASVREVCARFADAGESILEGGPSSLRSSTEQCAPS